MSGSTSFTPSETWHSGPFDLPNDDGDPLNFAALCSDAGASKGLLGKAFDNIKWLRGVYDAVASGIVSLAGTVSTHTGQLAAAVAGTLAVAGVKLTSQSIARKSAAWIPTATDGLGAAGWYLSNTGKPVQILAAATISCPLDLPHGSTLTAASVRILPDASHGLMTGVTLPILSIYRIAADGTTTTVAWETDPQSTLGGYQAEHAIPINGMTEVVDRSLYAYVAVLSGEDGANFKAGLIAYPVSVLFTSTALDNGAG